MKSAKSSQNARRSGGEEALEISLEHARLRHLGWAVFWLVAGALLIWKLGPISKVVGALMVVAAAWSARAFVLTLMHPAGVIRVGDAEVELPRGLCRGRTTRVPTAEVRHAFFLRRAVPWTHAGPLLVVEAGDDVFTYPRDWFRSDSDQRRVAMAINRHLGRA